MRAPGVDCVHGEPSAPEPHLLPSRTLCAGPLGLQERSTVRWLTGRHLFLTVPEAGKIKVQGNSVSGEDPRPGLLAVSSQGRWGRGLSAVTFIWALIAFPGAPPSWPNPLPEASSANSVRWGAGLGRMAGGGHERTCSRWHALAAFYET